MQFDLMLVRHMTEQLPSSNGTYDTYRMSQKLQSSNATYDTYRMFQKLPSSNATYDTYRVSQTFVTAIFRDWRHYRLYKRYDGDLFATG